MGVPYGPPAGGGDRYPPPGGGDRDFAGELAAAVADLARVHNFLVQAAPWNAPEVAPTDERKLAYQGAQRVQASMISRVAWLASRC
jgi:hypothetical protein